MSTLVNMKEYPEHEKLQKVKDESRSIGQFLDWLRNEKGYEICHWVEVDDSVDYGDLEEILSPIRETTQSLLAKYFGINQNKLKAEKRAMLETLREASHE